MSRAPRIEQAPARGRRGGGRQRVKSLPIVSEISSLVAATTELRRVNSELSAENEHLRAQLREIGVALGQLNGGRRGGGSRLAAVAVSVPQPKRQRKPITDPVVLEKRRVALAKARAVRAEKLAATRASGPAGEGSPA